MARVIRVLMALLVIVLGATSCSYQDPILKSFDGIEVITMEGNNADVDLNFTLENPNHQKIKLKTATFDVLINKIFIGKATLLEPTELPANGEYKIGMKMNLVLEKSIGDLALSLGLAILTNDIHLQVRGDAKGSLGLFSKTFPVDHSEKVDWQDLKGLSF